MLESTRSVKNPKRQFSRKNRRHDRVIDPEDIHVNPRPGGFFALHTKHFAGYVVLLCVLTVLFLKTPTTLAIAWLVSLCLPALWLTRYNRSKHLMMLALNDDSSWTNDTLPKRGTP